MIRLPILFRRPRYRLTYALVWLPYIALYQLINRFPVVTTHILPMTALDRAIPFVPGLLPLYIAYIPFFWWTGARSEDTRTANLFFYATHLQLLLCACVWLAYPVAMPRDLFYAAASYGWADSFWRWFDGPNNCLPSLHAANGLLFVQFNWNRPARPLHTAVVAGIIASTVLVKQHYAVDLIAGTCVYAVTAALLRRVEPSSARTAKNVAGLLALVVAVLAGAAVAGVVLDAVIAHWRWVRLPSLAVLARTLFERFPVAVCASILAVGVVALFWAMGWWRAGPQSEAR